MYNNLSRETVSEAIDTLRYIRRQYALYGRLDGLNMQHIDKALARVDIEIMFASETARQARRAGLEPREITFSEKPSIKVVAAE